MKPMKPILPTDLDRLRAGYANFPNTSLVKRLVAACDERDAEVARLRAALSARSQLPDPTGTSTHGPGREEAA